MFATDNFNGGVEGTELSAFNAAWSKPTGATGSCEIASNRVRSSATGTAVYIHSGVPANANYTVQALLYINSVASGNAVGVIGRALSSALTHYRAAINPVSGEVSLHRFNAGTATALVTPFPTVTMTVGLQLIIELVMTGDLIEVYTTIGGTRTQQISITDASPLTVKGFAGIRFLTPATAPTDANYVHLDAFVATDAEVAITVPDAPLIAFSAPDAGQIAVYFEAPADNGGAVITEYTATSVGGGTYTDTNTASPIYVTVPAGVAASFTVHATNSEGDSDESSASNEVTSLATAAAFHGRMGWQGAVENDGGVTWDKTGGIPRLRHGINARRQVIAYNGGWNGGGPGVAMHYEGTHDRTYISSTNNLGNILALAQDHKTGEIIGPVTVRSGLTADEHNIGHVNVLSDGRLLWAYTERSAPAKIRRSVSAEDISSWSTEVTVDAGSCNYHQTKILGSRIYSFYAWSSGALPKRRIRGSYSDNSGDTWATPVDILLDNLGSVYYGMSEPTDSGWVDLVAFSIQDGPETQRDLRHGIMREVDGVLTLFASDNVTELWAWGDAVIDYDLMTTVYDTGLADNSGPGNYTIGSQGVVRYSDTSVAILMIERKDPPIQRRFVWGRWNGTVWEHFDVTDAGEPLSQGGGITSTTYFGAGCQDQRVYGRLFVAKPVSDDSGGIYQYDIDDVGAATATFSLTRTVSPADYPLDYRPSSPRNYHESLPLIWASGIYRGYTGSSDINASEFAAQIVCEPVSIAGHGFLGSYVMDNTGLTVGDNQVYPRNPLTKTGAGTLALSASTIHGEQYLDFSTANNFYFVDTAVVDVVVDEATDLTQIAFVTDINPAAVSYFHSNRSASTSDGQDLRSNTSAALIVQALTNTDTSDSAVLPATPVMLSLVNDGTGLTAKGYIDDVEHVSVTAPTGNYLDRFMVGAGQAGASATISDLSHAIHLVTPKVLTASEIADVAALMDAGSYTSRWKEISSAGTGSPRVTVQADIPTGTSATLTVYEDTGTLINESDPVTLVDGEDTYTLTGLEGGAGNLYQFKFEPATTDRTVGAAIEYVAIEPGAEPPSLGSEQFRYGPTWDGTLLYNRTWGEAPAVEIEAGTLASTATALIVGAFLVTTLADSFTLDPPLRLNALTTQSVVATLDIESPTPWVIEASVLEATGAPSINGEAVYETDPLFSMGHVSLQSTGVPSVLGEFGYTYRVALENGVLQTTGACGVSGSLVIVGPVFLEGLVSCVVTYADSSSPIPVYDADDLVRIIATFTDGNTGQAGTPVNVAFNIRHPDGTVLAVTPTQEAIGVYSVGLTPSLEGNYRFNWKAQGVVQVGQFVVQPSLVAT